jgi:DNA-binding NtrC family response regulator
MSRVLLVEDEQVIRTELGRLLSRHGHEVALAATLQAARQECTAGSFGLVISDLRLPDGQGTEMIAIAGGAPVLIMTSYATVPSAVEAMKLGAVDYISKPFAHKDFVVAVERILEQHRSVKEAPSIRPDAPAPAMSGLVGQSTRMRDTFDRIRRVAPTRSTVFIQGESGTGKELVARAIHDLSPRASFPFVAVNCAAIPEGLIESELFGHEKGSFTGANSAYAGLVESAEGGTLFLDEVGDLPLPMQARFLRVLNDSEVRRVGAARARKVDVRVLSATHRDLPERIAQGHFREDLYFRLRVFELRLPALRERKEDIPELAQFLLKQACERLDVPVPELATEAVSHLSAQSWPGNVRELANALERAAIMCEAGTITPALLSADAAPEPSASDEVDASPSLLDYFKRFVREHEGQLSETELAKKLGISRKALWERRQRLNLPRIKSS